MNVSNRSLILMLVIAAVLSSAAAWLSLRPKPPEPDPIELARELNPPPPIKPIIDRTGAGELPLQGTIEVTVRNAGPEMAVTLECDRHKARQRFAEGPTVVFPDIPTTDCSVQLTGTETPWSLAFPGDTLTCRSERGSTTCDGGLATERPATVSIESQRPATLSMDGEEVGELPRRDLVVPVGQHELVLTYADVEPVTWSLQVFPDETVSVFFPDPSPPPILPEEMSAGTAGD